MSAITLATRVAQEQKTNVGHTVGYSVRFDNCCQADTKIKVSDYILYFTYLFFNKINIVL